MEEETVALIKEDISNYMFAIYSAPQCLEKYIEPLPHWHICSNIQFSFINFLLEMLKYAP